MEPSLVSVEEGDIILKMGSKVTEADLEKYSKYLNLTLEDRNLLPKRIFITIGTFLFSIIYITLIMPDFWKDTARSGIVSYLFWQILDFPVYIGTRLNRTFWRKCILSWTFTQFVTFGFCFHDSDDHGWTKNGNSSALMTSVFHATMQNAGIDTFAIGFSSALMEGFFCREVRLRGSALKAGALAGLTAAVISIGIGLASGSGAFTSINQAGVSLLWSFYGCIGIGSNASY